MQVSKEVEALREFERKLLVCYEACVGTLQRWVGASLDAHRAAAVRGLCVLLDKGFDFNLRDEVIKALVPVANSAEPALRSDACNALVALFEQDTHGEATLAAVRECSNLLKHSSFNVQPEVRRKRGGPAASVAALAPQSPQPLPGLLAHVLGPSAHLRRPPLATTFSARPLCATR